RVVSILRAAARGGTEAYLFAEPGKTTSVNDGGEDDQFVHGLPDKVLQLPILKLLRSL
ncbi:hypothetical protein L7F22_031521, partial [Adiantum nelumboides]|nr:hypothetical protein [Adiantum nelumboides]